jgi:hypothetical protein
LAWRDLLRTWGHESEIVAEHVDPEVIGDVHREVGGAGPDNVSV